MEEKPVAKSNTSWYRKIFFIAIGVVVVLALALGLGLGLGLKNRHTSTSTSTQGNSGASAATQDWRRSVLDYKLDLNSWDLNAKPTTRTYNFTVSEIHIAPDGVNRTVFAINGQFPAPLIRLNRGDRLVVNLTNNLLNATTLHWHGLFQNGTNWFDGTSGVTQCPVPPGQSFIYNFTVGGQSGTYWYHAHFSTQYVDGIVGPLIVHAPEEADLRQQYDFDQVVMLQDWYHDPTNDLLDTYLSAGNENAEPVPDSGLIQGENYFNCSSYGSDSGYDCNNSSSRAVFSFQQNKRYRLRFINAGAFTPFQVSVDNHTLAIIEVDGTMVEPLPIHRFEIHTAQRYSAILATNQSSSTNYWLRAQMNTNCYAGDNDVLDPMVLALITYENTTAAPTASADWSDALDLICRDLNSTELVPSSPEQPPTADAVYELQFFFRIGAYQLDRADVNGTSWIGNMGNPTLNQAVSGLKSGNNSFSAAGGIVSSAFSTNQFVISLPSSQKVVDLIIMNFDDGSHPFHLHGHKFWVMANADYQYFPWDSDLYSKINSTSVNVYTKNPVRRDTLTIGPYNWALIRFENNVPGQWAFHCHNVWHMEAGLLMQFMAQPEIMKGWSIPDDVMNLCKS